MITLEQIKNNPVVQRYMFMGNDYIGTIGAIEHSVSHAEYTSKLCYHILNTLGYPEREAQIAAVAGYLHDIGNLVNRYGHGMSGAIIAFRILLEMGMAPEEIAIIIGAIGNHEEQASGHSVNSVAAALILADKSDVHRSRVRKRDTASFTPRDRVNYAVSKTSLDINAGKNIITLRIDIDTEVCSVMEYFEIFLTKMLMSRRAARFLGCEFELLINGNRLL